MKHIKKFESFYNNNVEHYKYLDLELLKNGDLKISLTEDGIKNAKGDNGISFSNFGTDYFDDIQGNSSWMYFDDMSDYELGMTESPCITDEYYFDENYKVTDEETWEISQLYWYPNYMITNFTDELYKNGFVIFKGTQKTPKEIEEIRLSRDMKKFNV